MNTSNSGNVCPRCGEMIGERLVCEVCKRFPTKEEQAAILQLHEIMNSSSQNVDIQDAIAESSSRSCAQVSVSGTSSSYSSGRSVSFSGSNSGHDFSERNAIKEECQEREIDLQEVITKSSSRGCVQVSGSGTSSGYSSSRSFSFSGPNSERDFAKWNAILEECQEREDGLSEDEIFGVVKIEFDKWRKGLDDDD